MASLTPEHKAFVIKRFARYEAVSDVVIALKTEYGITVTASQLYAYHPDSVGYRSAQKWRELFYAERKAFLEGIDSIGISQKTYRLQSLHTLHAVAMRRNNVALAAQLMEQAAKEMGEVFTNRREVRAETRSITATMTTEELRQEILNDLKVLGVEAPTLALPGLGPRDPKKMQ
jgi:hypothetical protein